MFGYIRPVTPELKVKELENFKACYCGLCHSLGHEYGPFARFILNYDFVFLAMLLWDRDTELDIEYKRCLACPHKKKKCVAGNNALKTAAGLSIILTWWKLQDEIADESFYRAALCRFLALFLRKAYKKAKSEFPEFDSTVSDYLNKLSEFENSKCASVDAPADCFAKILSSASTAADGNKARILDQVLYHTGRWIYIVDACDDFADDVNKGKYNPVAMRFSQSSEITEEMKERLSTTLLHSRNLVGNAFELLDETVWSNIIRNIIVLAMPAVAQAVLTGEWKKSRPGHGNL